MRISGRILILFLASFLIAVSSIAQVASFTASPTSGCAPLLVRFQNTSTGATSNLWDFGNGQIERNQPSLTNVFTEPGVYIISLTAVSGGSQTTTTETITVFASPIAMIQATDTAGCAPHSTVLSDASVLGSAPIDHHIWNLGDGTTASTASVNKTYPSIGNYNIYLQVTDENGCKDDTTYIDFIQVSVEPIASFTADITASCTVPQNVTFTNTSTGSNLAYSWDYADSNTSIVEEETHEFTEFGIYNVTLDVVDGNGCSGPNSSASQTLTFLQTEAIFTLPSDTICVDNAVNQVNASLGSDSYEWDFGGTAYNIQNPTHTFTDTGWYNIRLIAVFGNDECRDTLIDSVYVIDMEAKFAADTVFACSVPFTVNFSDSSTNVTNWNWTFGDGNTSTTTNTSNIYNSEGDFTVTLTGTNNYGCSDSFTETIDIEFPVAHFGGDTREGCTPLTVNFRDSSSSVYPIVDWLWDFGDDSTATSQDTSHIYLIDSAFVASLTVTDSLGCQDSDTFLITIGENILFDIAFTTDSACGEDTVFYTFSSTAVDSIDYWMWEFGDGGTSTERDPMHLFVDTGFMDLSLFVTYNGCNSDTLDSLQHVFIEGPILQLSTTHYCDTPSVYYYNTDVINATKLVWDFGDGVKDSADYSTDTTFMHTVRYDYAVDGNYNYIITAYNDSSVMGCDFVDSILVYAGEPIAVLNYEDSVCANVLTQFAAADTGSAILNYTWDFGDGTDSTLVDSLISHSYASGGTYKVILTVADPINCEASDSINLVVHQPVVDFTASDTIGCSPFILDFINNSDTTLGSTYDWDFGNATSSTDHSPTGVTYTNNANYSVNLTITDSLSCVGGLTKSMYITASRPVPAFSIADATLCKPDSVRLANGTTVISGNTLEYTWVFGDGDSSKITSPYHTFQDTGYFDVKLIASDTAIGNCADSTTISQVVHVQDVPVVDFRADTTKACYPAAIEFSDSTKHDYILPSSYFWDFGDGKVSTEANPTNLYELPDTFTVTMRLQTTYGCRDTLEIVDYILVNGPIAAITAQDDEVCLNDSLYFLVTDTFDLEYITWSFQDYSQDAVSNEDTLYHVFSLSSQDNFGSEFVPFIFMRSISGCEPPPIALDPILVHHFETDFNVDTTYACLPYSFAFEGLVETSASTPPSATWTMSDGYTSTFNDHTYHFDNAPGIYDVTFDVSDANGCSKVITRPQYIELDGALATSTVLDSACMNTILDFEISGQDNVDTYEWDFGDGTIVQGADAITEHSYSVGGQKYGVKLTYKSAASVDECVYEIIDSIYIHELIADFIYTSQNLSGDTIFDCFPFEVEFLDQSSVTTSGWEWNFGDGESGTSEDEIHEFSEMTTQATLVIFNDPEFGCSDTITKPINIVCVPTVDVPTAFTPGSVTNNVIYLNGKGIKEVQEWKIYNRWGQVIFESTDTEQGWDGTYLGKDQPSDTYVYTAKVISVNDEVMEKKGKINLIR